MPMIGECYKIRHLREDEIPKLLELCKKEGRHMGKAEEVMSWLKVDPNAFFVAVTDDGEILGNCCGMRLSKTHGYLGMYVVRAEFRGIGIGMKVWNAAIEHLGSRNNGLSAVPDLFDLYRERAGFAHVAEWTIDLYKLEKMAQLYKYFGQEHHTEIIEQFYISNCCVISKPISKLRTVPMSADLISEVISYDNQLHSYDRSKIVGLTLTEHNCRSRVALLGNTVVGYGCIKPNLQNMWMISPLYADNEYIAKMLMSDMIGSLSMLELDEGVVLKSPSNNHSAKNLLTIFGFQKQTYCLKRCYTKYVFSVPTQNIFALHTSVFCTE